MSLAEQVDHTNPYDPELPWVPCETFGEVFFDTAPVRFQNEVDLPVSPARLFEIFEDAASWPKWATGIGRVDWTSPEPYGIGTTRTVTFWGGVKVYEVFDIWSPGKAMSFHFVGTTETIWRRFGENYVVTDRGNDRCTLNWTVAYEPAGGFAKAHPWVKPVMRLNLASYMWRLKRYCAKHATA